MPRQQLEPNRVHDPPRVDHYTAQITRIEHAIKRIRIHPHDLRTGLPLCKIFDIMRQTLKNLPRAESAERSRRDLLDASPAQSFLAAPEVAVLPDRREHARC